MLDFNKCLNVKIKLNLKIQYKSLDCPYKFIMSDEEFASCGEDETGYDSDDCYHTPYSVIEDNYKEEGKDDKDYQIVKVSSIKEFIKTEHFDHNNTLNKDHVQDLKQKIKQNKSGILKGTFSIIKFKDNTIILMDGHHRLQALEELYEEKDFDEDFEFFVEVNALDIEHSQTDDKVLEVFRRLNNTKPFNNNMSKTVNNRNIMIKVEDKWKHLFSKTKEKKRNKFPYLNKEGFSQALRKMLDDIENVDEESIFNKIVEHNRKLRSEPLVYLKKLYPKLSDDEHKKKETQLKKNKCYLGMLSSDTEYEWLNKLLL